MYFFRGKGWGGRGDQRGPLVRTFSPGPDHMLLVRRLRCRTGRQKGPTKTDESFKQACCWEEPRCAGLAAGVRRLRMFLPQGVKGRCAFGQLREARATSIKAKDIDGNGYSRGRDRHRREMADCRESSLLCMKALPKSVLPVRPFTHHQRSKSPRNTFPFSASIRWAQTRNDAARTSAAVTSSMGGSPSWNRTRRPHDEVARGEEARGGELVAHAIPRDGGEAGDLRVAHAVPRDGGDAGELRVAHAVPRDGGEAGELRVAHAVPRDGGEAGELRTVTCPKKKPANGTVGGAAGAARVENGKMGNAAPQALLGTYGTLYTGTVQPSFPPSQQVTQSAAGQGLGGQGGGTNRRGGGAGPVFLSPLVVLTTAPARKALRRSLCPYNPRNFTEPNLEQYTQMM
eukprot:gene5479-biopygen4223